MTIPGFDAERALPKSNGLPHSVLPSTTLKNRLAVIPQQLLFPPDTPIFTCSPPCTWGPPQTQVCCAVICWGQLCFPICYAQSAPQCPR
jgi:hypothetical protein